MRPVLDGVRIVEVAQYVFVPVASGILAEWGADVIKVEHPVRADAYRGLRRTGNLPTAGTINYAVEHANRGKRSIGIDLAHPDGRATLSRLLADADVLITNLLPESRRRIGLDLTSVRRDNPKLVYARGTALGERGPERDRGGYDHATFWARSGAQFGATPEGAERPSPMPSGAFGDSGAGLALAGGIAAALFARERTGEATTVDLSLLGMGLWSMASAVTGAMQNGYPAAPLPRVPAFNPLAGTYRSADGRWVVLGLLQGFHQWPAFCRAVGRDDWVGDPRFATREAFEANGQALEAMLDTLFASEPVDYWRASLAGLDAVWEIVQDTDEVAADPQTVANGHVATLGEADESFRLVTSPIQFGEGPPQPQRAPEACAHTEEILLEIGIDWPEITRLKELGAIN